MFNHPRFLRTLHNDHLTLLPNQCRVRGQMGAVLTVQVTLSDSLHILGMNELVAPLPDNVHRRQVHVVANPDKINSDSLNVYPLKRLLRSLTFAVFAGRSVKLNKCQLGLVKITKTVSQQVELVFLFNFF